MASGGEIKNTSSGRAIYCYDNNYANIKVSGTAVVSNTGGGDGAVTMSGNVEVIGGMVSATTGKAIQATDENASVNVSSGTVSATTGTAIQTAYETASVNISGGEVKTTGTGGKAVDAIGNITVSGGKVNAVNGGAIEVGTGNVTVSGATTEVSTTNAAAIRGSTGTVNINGGTVYSSNVAIVNTSGKITIDGGIVTSSINNSSFAIINSNGLVEIKSGSIIATGAIGVIKTADTVALSGGAISVTTGIAIEAKTVRATGGNLATVSNSGGTNPAIKTTGTATHDSLLADGSTAKITVTGNIVSANTGIKAFNGAAVTVTGNVNASGNYGVDTGSYGVVTVNGNITVCGGVNSTMSATVNVNGNTTATNGVGIETSIGGKVYFNGTVTGTTDMQVDGTPLIYYSPTTTNGLEKDGYFWDVYTKTGVTPQSYVYIRKGLIVLPVVDVELRDKDADNATVKYSVDTQSYIWIAFYTGAAETKTSADVKTATGAVQRQTELLTPVSNISNWTFTNLTANTQYTCYMVATDLFGISSTVATVTFTTLETHTHSLQNSWQKYATGHWHICNTCMDILDFAAHTSSDWIVITPATATAEGVRVKKCTVCDYQTAFENIPKFVAPTLTGPTAMTLTEGYIATSTSAYTITGNPKPTVTKTSGDAKITWNNDTKKLDIAAGLAEGIYEVTLTASNGIAPDATVIFTLTITEENTTPNILKGDINNDGKVNGMDLLLVKQHILAVPGKNIEAKTNAFKAADMNDDGKINGMDLLLLKKKILS